MMFGKVLLNKKLFYPPPLPPHPRVLHGVLPALDFGEADVWFKNAHSVSMPKIRAVPAHFDEVEGSAPKSPNQIARVDEEVGAHNKPQKDLIPAETNIHEYGSGIEITLHAGGKFQQENKISIEGKAHVQSGNVQGKEVWRTPAPPSILKKPSALNSTKSANVKRLAKTRTIKKDRKMYVRDQARTAHPFVSMAEMIRKFESGLRESYTSSTKAKLTLTRPKTPKFEITHRVRSFKTKSSAELEEELMAKIPMFKPRQLNKKGSGIEMTLNARGKCNQDNESSVEGKVPSSLHVQGKEVCCTPAPPSILKNPSALNSTKELPKLQAQSTKSANVKRETNARKIVGIPIVAKSHKLNGGKTNLVSNSSGFCPSVAKTRTNEEDGKMYVRDQATQPFVSMAEMMRKFESGLRESHTSSSSDQIQGEAAGNVKKKAELTRPKTPEFKTQRVRSCKTKSSAELEEVLNAKIPKFKARPLNKKIFEASTLPPLQRRRPHPPEFKEFHLETRAGANHNAEPSTGASTKSTAPKLPLLQTSLCARPPKTKTTQELEKDELENIPQFKEKQKPLARNTTPNPFLLHSEERGEQKEKKIALELLQKQFEDERAKIPIVQPYPCSTDYPVIPPKTEPMSCTITQPYKRRRMEIEEAEMIFIQSSDLRLHTMANNHLHSSKTTYEILTVINRGSYGVVYLARDQRTGEIVAVKEEFTGLSKSTEREISILRNLADHPSIVKLKDLTIDNERRVFVVMEYMESDMQKLMASRMNNPLTSSEIKWLMKKLLEGVTFIHKKGVMHRDLKPSNVLVDGTKGLKLCDFGLSRWFNQESGRYTREVVTLWYRAPELLLGADEYSCAIDMWSVGCIMGELLRNKVVFEGRSEIDQLGSICKVLGVPNDANNLLRQKFDFLAGYPMVTDCCYDLLNKLLTYDPKNRITATEALHHPWFNEGSTTGLLVCTRC